MADAVSPLGNATFAGFATVREIGPLGMISLRAKNDMPGLADAFGSIGLTVPEVRRFTGGGDRLAGWMSPDEYLLILPYAEVSAALASLTASPGRTAPSGGQCLGCAGGVSHRWRQGGSGFAQVGASGFRPFGTE